MFGTGGVTNRKKPKPNSGGKSINHFLLIGSGGQVYLYTQFELQKILAIFMLYLMIAYSKVSFLFVFFLKYVMYNHPTHKILSNTASRSSEIKDFGTNDLVNTQYLNHVRILFKDFFSLNKN